MQRRPRSPLVTGGRLGRRSFLAGTGAVAAGLTLGRRPARAAEEPKLRFYNWDTYIGETTLADFDDASGIAVEMDLFADNDELFARLEGGNPGYDVVVPSNDFVERMIAAGMLLPLDHDLIPNAGNIDPAFQDAAFDPGRLYSMPYMWGTLGVGFRKSRVDGVPDSWRWLLDSDRYSGRVALLGEAAAVIGAAHKYLGNSYNSTDSEQIAAAEALLIRQKPHIRAFAEDNGQDLLLSGEVDLTMEWNGDILQVMAEDDDLSFVVPREGAELWQDALCIPVGAPHPGNAHTFINFILDAEVGAAIADAIQYATPNKAARALMPDAYNNNPAIFPSSEVIARCEPPLYLGEDGQRRYDEAWMRILAA